MTAPFTNTDKNIEMYICVATTVSVAIRYSYSTTSGASAAAGASGVCGYYGQIKRNLR